MELIDRSNALIASMASLVAVMAVISSLHGMVQSHFFLEMTRVFPRMKETIFSSLTKRWATGPQV